MSQSPDSLVVLLSAPDDPARDVAWPAFLAAHSGLILQASHSHDGDHDAVMDRYLFVIQALRERGCIRLRQYAPVGGARFTTWLLVVARRLCSDYHRSRYGRSQSGTDAAATRHSERRQLVDLIGNDVGLERLEEPLEHNPDAILRRSVLHEALDRALAELPTSDRLLLRFRFQDDLSVPEITRLVDGGSPFATYRRLDKILARVRAILEAAGVDGPHP